MNRPRPETAGQIEAYLRAFDQDIARGESTHDALSNESLFIPIFKRALRLFELGGNDLESLVDTEAEEIRDGVRLAKDILSEKPFHFQAAPTLLANICPEAIRAGEDVGDMLNIATALAALSNVPEAVATPLGYAVVAFSLVRLGVRALCSKR